MPVTNQSGSQRERRAGRYNALSDCDGTGDIEAFMIRSCVHIFQPDGLTNLGKWALLGISNEEGLGVSVHTGGWERRNLEDIRNAIRTARARKSPSGAPAQAVR